MNSLEMRRVAGWIDQAVEAVKRGDESVLERIASQVAELTSGFPAPGISVGD